jgi:hypothetical protein
MNSKYHSLRFLRPIRCYLKGKMTMKSAIIIDFTIYQNRQTAPSDAEDHSCSDELANAIQALILEMRNPLKQTG